nr:hypothetical protein BaRGS_006243 [Batillaria attramentaria]
MVPWDDDVDFAVPYVMRENVSTLLGSLQPRYYLDKRERVRFKFYSNSSYPTKKTWRWPFLDISFYIESDSEVYDSDTKFKKVFSFRKQDVFPLTGRPFSGRLLPAPRDSLAVLKKNYDLEHCATGWYTATRKRPF